MIPGDRLGHYEILSALGEGGMGQVWRAIDKTLRRDVAIKTLPPLLARDPDRLARLEREAELLASLNHPNIAVIHGFGEHDGTRFLVLELVEGDTLEERLLKRGRFSIDDALPIASQIAEALETAHGRGIIHRDLKPANIKITPEGRVKVLDFGLGKAIADGSDADETLAQGQTRTGMVLGTPAYMSPEQARGEKMGPQTDIWSFGVVLLELLTGRSPFKQPTAAETLARLLSGPPDFALLPADTPAGVRRLLRRCLEKDQSRRLQHMGDVRIELEEARATPEAPVQETSRVGPTRGRWPLAGGAIALTVLAGLIGFFAASRGAPTETLRMSRASIPFVADTAGVAYGVRQLAIASDGSRVAFGSARRLLVRRLDQKDAVSIFDGWSVNPFFSPDGRWIGFFGDEGLKKIPVDGGMVTVIAANSARGAGATWCGDGTIVFATTEGLFTVSQDGGTPQLALKPDRPRQERLYGWPQFLPGCRSLLFTVLGEDAATPLQVMWLDLSTKERRKVITGGGSAQYAGDGVLVYASGPSLRAIGFDPKSGLTRGEAVPIVDSDVDVRGDARAADYAVSSTGALVFREPSTTTATAGLEWIDRSGRHEALAVEPRAYAYARISPDGGRLALDIGGRDNRDIWVLDLGRVSMTQLTDGPTEDNMPAWSTDGTRVFFASNRTGNFDIYSQQADGATPARVEFAGPGNQMPASAVPDGSQLIVHDEYTNASVLRFSRPDRLEPVLQSEADESQADVSPDGRWIVYESDESGKQREIFLRPFPNAGDRREKLSINGGRFPMWSPKGDEIFYITMSGDMMAVKLALSPTLRIGTSTKLFTWGGPLSNNRSGMAYDVSPRDGRFLRVQRGQAIESRTLVSIVQNWAETIRTQITRP